MALIARTPGLYDLMKDRRGVWVCIRFNSDDYHSYEREDFVETTLCKLYTLEVPRYQA